MRMPRFSQPRKAKVVQVLSRSWDIHRREDSRIPCGLVFVNENEYALIRALASAKRVAVRYGGDGSAMSKYGRQVAKAPSVEVAAANTVGAGEAFGATLDLALRSGLDYTRALPW